MGKLRAFDFVSLDGYLNGPNGDISWTRHDAEEAEFSGQNAESGSTLLFGRKTFELMAGYWPTPMARQNNPATADGMNKADKIVFSRTLKTAEWSNTRLVKDNIAEEVRKLKQMPGKEMTLLGSGSILTQLTEQGLIDEYQIMLNPVAIGSGTPIFQGIRRKLDLKLIATRTFKSGVLLLTYQPVTGEV